MKKKVDVLYVEDSEDYINFVGRAVKKINPALQYHYVTDGTDAIKYIEEHKDEINIPREAYITFETEESVRHASQIMSSKS